MRCDSSCGKTGAAFYSLMKRHFVCMYVDESSQAKQSEAILTELNRMLIALTIHLRKCSYRTCFIYAVCPLSFPLHLLPRHSFILLLKIHFMSYHRQLYSQTHTLLKFRKCFANFMTRHEMAKCSLWPMVKSCFRRRKTLFNYF